RAVTQGERLLVLDADLDRGPGRDVGHARGEQVGALLLDQRTLLALRLGALVVLAGLAAFLDPPLDRALAHAHPDVVDRAVVREREDENAFERGLAGVGEALGHHAAHGAAGDLHA